MTAEVKSSNSKKRSAAYYREYRRRRKESLAKVIALPGLKLSNDCEAMISAQSARLMHKGGGISHVGMGPIKPGSGSWEYVGKKLPGSLVVLLVVFMTGLLIHLSAPFYMKSQSQLMAYVLASAVELSLLLLISMKVRGVWEKLTKHILVFALSAYAILPVALNPIFEAQRGLSVAQSKMQQTEQRAASLRSEIQSRNNRVQILKERGRITAAQTELQTVAQLENELRNTIANVQPVATSHLELHASYLLALQRLLLMLCNLFFAHRLSIHCQTNRKRGRKINHSWSFPIGIGCAT